MVYYIFYIFYVLLLCIFCAYYISIEGVRNHVVFVYLLIEAIEAGLVNIQFKGIK